MTDQTVDPGATALSFRDVAELLALDESRLRYWAQTGLCGPSLRRSGRQYFTFCDLVQVKAARELCDQGVPVQRVRRAMEALRTSWPQEARPLERLRVCSDGERIVVLDQAVAFDPGTGQLVMEFELGPLSDAAARTSGVPMGELDRGGSAFGAFSSGLAAEDAGDDETAERFYQAALRMDDHLAAAHTNFGNILHRRGERGAARERYERALAIDPDQVEARFNLANLLAEVDEHDLAIAEYRRVLARAPEFADAHFNLALAFEGLGETTDAHVHFTRYVELDPGPNEWTAAAQDALDRLA
jgi:tetratricopeptide (TPR) repeat protein